VRKIVVPAAWKTASNEAVKLEPRSRIRNPEVLESLVERQVAGLLDRPLPGGVGGDAAQVHPAGAVLDEHQHSVESGLSWSSRICRAGDG
jgi:hypothetical protein